MSAAIAWVLANQALVATTLLVVSEGLGANSKIKSNGILSFVLIQLNQLLKSKATPKT